jgi:hypothetical protein
MDKPNKEREKNDILLALDDIEEIDTILSEKEIRILNNIFSDFNDFTRIIDDIDTAISDRVIDSRDVGLLYHSISKLVNHRSKNRIIRKENRARWFFEFPEMIIEKYLRARAQLLLFLLTIR